MRAGIKHTVGMDWKASVKGVHRLKVNYEITARASARDYKSTLQVLINGKNHESREISLSKSRNGTISLDLNLSANTNRIEFGMVPNNGDTNNNVSLAVKVLKVEMVGPPGSID